MEEKFYFNGRELPAKRRYPSEGWTAAQEAADIRWGHETAPEWLAELDGHPDQPPIKLKAKDEQQAQARYAEVVGMTPGVHQGTPVSVKRWADGAAN
jgi:hypothetical protein